nr:hypothetical protein [Tanacetum cinerariifolium]
THLSRNILTVPNEISDCCGLKLLDVIVKYQKIISSSRLQLSAKDQKSLSEKRKEEEHLHLPSHQKYPTDVALRIRDEDTDEGKELIDKLLYEIFPSQN